jgi:hypothetical protein
MITDINSEDRLVQKTFAEHLHDKLGWDSVYAWNEETFGPNGTLGRAGERDVVLVRDLRAALPRLNPALPESARTAAKAWLKPPVRPACQSMATEWQTDVEERSETRMTKGTNFDRITPLEP